MLWLVVVQEGLSLDRRCQMPNSWSFGQSNMHIRGETPSGPFPELCSVIVSIEPSQDYLFI